MLVTQTADQTKNWIQDTCLIMGYSILIALSGKLALRFSFTPVPLFFQVNLIWAAGLFLGSRRAFLAVALFVAQGLAGLPVFSSGQSGLAVLLSPVGGYIASYAFAAFLIGYLYERSNQKTISAFLSLTAGMCLTYAIGCLWLAKFVGFANVLMLGVAPFIAKGMIVNGLFASQGRLRNLYTLWRGRA